MGYSIYVVVISENCKEESKRTYTVERFLLTV